MRIGSNELTRNEMIIRRLVKKAEISKARAWLLMFLLVSAIAFVLAVSGCDHECPIGTDGSVDVSADG